MDIPFSLLGKLPWMVASLCGVLIVMHLFVPRWGKFFSVKRIRNALVGFYLLYPTLLTGLQWSVWSRTDFGRTLLSLPLDPSVPLPGFLEFLRQLFEHSGGYFAFYALGRFWFTTLLAFIAATLFQLVFAVVCRLRSHKKFEEGSLPFLAALIAGWPGAIVFVPLFILCALAHGIARALRGNMETPFGPSLALAALVVALFAPWIVQLLHLTPLSIRLAA